VVVTVMLAAPAGSASATVDPSTTSATITIDTATDARRRLRTAPPFVARQAATRPGPIVDGRCHAGRGTMTR
jgi:hypothetical protein